MNTQTASQKAYRKALKRNSLLTDRYNREYMAGKWSTNRPLAGACEDAYSAAWTALDAVRREMPATMLLTAALARIGLTRGTV